MVIWLQGCTLGCPGCANLDTHSHAPRNLVSVDGLMERMAPEQTHIEGITLTGGEPLEQADGLLALLVRVRETTDLSVVLFTGFTLAEIRGEQEAGLGEGARPPQPASRDVLQHIDVLIAGQYDRSRHVGRGLIASANQQIHLLTHRYTIADIEATPPGEFMIAPDGATVATGIDPPRIGASGARGQ